MSLGIDPVSRIHRAVPTEPARPRGETGQPQAGEPGRRRPTPPAARTATSSSDAAPEADSVDTGLPSPLGTAHDLDALLPFPVALLMPTHYARLGVSEQASAAEIEAAWRRLRPPGSEAEGHTAQRSQTLQALPWPQGAAPEPPAVRARQRELAHAVLTDPLRRAVYDRWLATHRSAITAGPAQSGWQGWLHSARVHRRISIAVGLAALAALVWTLT